MGHIHRVHGAAKSMMEQPVRSAIETEIAASPLWGRSIAWLFFLGPFFFLSYGFANHMAAEKGVTASYVFGWEHHIPFVPWTIVPYWSIDLFYGLSFLLCHDKSQVDRHALRLLTAQLISIAFFLLIPLHFAFDRPHIGGMFGSMFDALMGFDQPYNQAPSLHISLLVILWTRFAQSVKRPWSWLVHVWALLIGISVLTTYQHHFIDIPTGALAGLLCLWVWPNNQVTPLTREREPTTKRHYWLASYYLIGALLLAAIAVSIGGVALWLWWGTAALFLVSLAYVWFGGSSGFQKQDGKHSLAVKILLAPYLIGAWINSRWWTRHHPQPVAVLDNVWLGRMPTEQDMQAGQFAALCDVTAEMPAPRGNWRYVGLPWLDLIAPTAAQLNEAAHHIEVLRAHGPVLVCCALGYSRSACAVLAWLLATGRTASVEDAEAILRASRPQLVLTPAHRAALIDLLAFRQQGKKHE
jgi:protein-tyrosine phosphatase